MKKIIITILLYLWQLPQLLVALVMYPFLGKKKMVGKDKYGKVCYEAEKMKGGISLGPISYVGPGSREETIAHELKGHTKDSLYFGPLYLLVIGLPSIIWAMTYDWKKHCYYDFYTECRANRFAGLVVKNCRLFFKEEEK